MSDYEIQIKEAEQERFFDQEQIRQDSNYRFKGELKKFVSSKHKLIVDLHTARMLKKAIQYTVTQEYYAKVGR